VWRCETTRDLSGGYRREENKTEEMKRKGKGKEKKGEESRGEENTDAPLILVGQNSQHAREFIALVLKYSIRIRLIRILSF
jgi:hypothetical protein